MLDGEIDDFIEAEIRWLRTHGQWTFGGTTPQPRRAVHWQASGRPSRTARPSGRPEGTALRIVPGAPFPAGSAMRIGPGRPRTVAINT